MSEKAQRYSKRRIRQQLTGVMRELNARVDKIRGQLVITPKTALKGYVKWTAGIRRAARPLAEQFGLKTVVGDGRVIYS